MENEFTQETTAAPSVLPEAVIPSAKKHFSRLGCMFFVGTLLIFIVQTIASLIVGAIKPEWLSHTGSALLVSMLPMYAIAMPLMGYLISRIPATEIAKKKMSPGQLSIAFLMCYGGMYVSNLIGNILTQLIGLIKGTPVTNTMVEIATSSDLWVNFVIMVLCAPVAEELLFRKLLLDRAVKFGEAPALLLSGLIFALFHGNLNQFAYAFVLGICFAFIYLKTGTVRYSIYLHMAINFVGSVLGVLILRLIGEDFIAALNDPALLLASVTDHLGSIWIYFSYAFLLLALAIAGIILVIVKFKHIHLLAGEVTLPKGKTFSVMFLNVGMGLYVIFWLIMILIQLFAA